MDLNYYRAIHQRGKNKFNTFEIVIYLCKLKKITQLQNIEVKENIDTRMKNLDPPRKSYHVISST